MIVTPLILYFDYNEYTNYKCQKTNSHLAKPIPNQPTTKQLNKSSTPPHPTPNKTGISLAQ